MVLATVRYFLVSINDQRILLWSDFLNTVCSFWKNGILESGIQKVILSKQKSKNQF